MIKKTKQQYDDLFFSEVENTSRPSAREIVPLVLSYVKCRSVVDVGCGTGVWLSEFKDHGVIEVFGIDGDYVDLNMLQIAREDFQAFDLTQKLSINRKFDLAISLEVAEHLPSTSAAAFIESLTQFAPVVLFSASIPHQEGTNHINEQWIDYWVDLFAQKDFTPIDILRWQIWQNDKIAWWFKQNILFFVQNSKIANYPKLAEHYQHPSKFPLSVVHPDIYLHHTENTKKLKTILSKPWLSYLLRVDSFVNGKLLKRQ